MPQFWSIFVAILNVLVGDMPQIETAISGFWTFMAAEFNKLFGIANAKTQLTGMIQQAEGEVRIHDADGGAQATNFICSQWNTVPELLAAFPGLAPSLAIRKALVDGGATHAMAAKVVEASHSNVRVADPAYQAQIATLTAAKP